MNPKQQRAKRKQKHNRIARKRAKALCVAIYDVNRYEGGPEEGGWFYDAGSLVSVEATFFNQSKAWREASRLNAWCDADNAANERRELSSVLCDGVLQAKVMPCPAPAGFPEQRPHYE